LAIRGCVNKINHTSRNNFSLQKMQKTKLVALSIFFQLSLFPNYWSNFFKIIPFKQASTVCRYCKCRERFLCIYTRMEDSGIMNKNINLQNYFVSFCFKKKGKKGGKKRKKRGKSYSTIRMTFKFTI